MEQLYNGFDTLVVVGSWNQYIFTEEWIVNNILAEGVEYTIQYPLNPLGSLQFTLNNIRFRVLGGRLTFQIVNNPELACREIIKIARSIFQKLIHTPVTALGINYLYESKECAISNFSHDTELVAATGYDITASELTRSFKISTNETLNLKIELKEEKNIFNFNYDYKINKIEDILDIIGDEDNIIKEKNEASNKIITQVYSITNG